MNELTLPSGKIAQTLEGTGRILLNANRAAQDSAEVDYYIVAALSRFQNSEGGWDALSYDELLDDIDYEDTMALQVIVFDNVIATKMPDNSLRLPSGRIVKVAASKTRALVNARKKAFGDREAVPFYIIAELVQLRNEQGEYETVIVEELWDEFSYSDVLALNGVVFEKKTAPYSESQVNPLPDLSGTVSNTRKSKK